MSQDLKLDEMIALAERVAWWEPFSNPDYLHYRGEIRGILFDLDPYWIRASSYEGNTLYEKKGKHFLFFSDATAKKIKVLHGKVVQSHYGRISKEHNEGVLKLRRLIGKD